MKRAKDPTGITSVAEWLDLELHVATEAFLDGLLLMLAFGIAHSANTAIPAFGYWNCVFFSWVLGGIAATGTTGVYMRVRKLGRLVVPQ